MSLFKIEYAYFTDKDGNILPPNHFKGDEEE